jgi:hypothetical protein
MIGPTFTNEVEVIRLHLGRASAKSVELLEVVQKGIGLDSLDTKVFLPRPDTELEDVIGAVLDENRAVRAAICA